MSVGKHHVIPFYQKYPKISQLYIYLYTSIISHCIPPLGSPALRPKTPGYSARYAMPHWNMEGTRWRMGRVHAGWGERQGFWSFFGGFEGCKKMTAKQWPKKCAKNCFSCRTGEHGKVLGILLPNWCFPTFLFGNVLENRLFSAKQNGWTGVNGTATDWNLECLHVSQNDLSRLLECFEKQFWIVFWIGCDIQLEFWSIVFFGLAANWLLYFAWPKNMMNLMMCLWFKLHRVTYVLSLGIFVCLP